MKQLTEYNKEITLINKIFEIKVNNKTHNNFETEKITNPTH